jgi:D-erythro-7,8-dihydroneopterin triphosphate epimerase
MVNLSLVPTADAPYKRENTVDKIIIEDLLLRCVIGVYAWERELKQDVIFNITLSADLRKAGRTDNVADTVDYKQLKQSIIELVESSAFQLIETLAEQVAARCLAQPGVQAVKVRVDKPGALRFARTVGVEIERSN